MIIEYHRPEKLKEALRLLARPNPRTLPLGGGSVLNQAASLAASEPIAVVDLQALGLGTLEVQENTLVAGATVTLQNLLDQPGLPDALYGAIRHEATHNLRQVATLAGTAAAAGGRSPLATALLALDAVLEIHSLAEGKQRVKFGDWLPRRGETPPGQLITALHLPLSARLAYEYVARSPADLPIVCAAAAQWPGGRTRLALGGFGAAPALVLDGAGTDGAAEAARSAYSLAEDAWASAEYRAEMAAVLARRCLQD